MRFVCEHRLLCDNNLIFRLYYNVYWPAIPRIISGIFQHLHPSLDHQLFTQNTDEHLDWSQPRFNKFMKAFSPLGIIIGYAFTGTIAYNFS